MKISGFENEKLIIQNWLKEEFIVKLTPEKIFNEKDIKNHLIANIEGMVWVLFILNNLSDKKEKIENKITKLEEKFVHGCEFYQ